MKLPDDPSLLTDDALAELASEATALLQEDRKRNQILYYQAASPRAQLVHECKSKVIGIGGGNGSSKSETMLVDLIMSATGVFPYSQRHLIDQKFRGPVPCRLVVESLTTTLETIILPKLQWWKWTGIDRPGGARGHFGWIPQTSLIDGQWEKSWSAKLRVLRLVCRDPHNPDKVLGESSIQCMSQDQDATDFASGDFAVIAHDEPPKLAQWRENEARTMRMDGRMLLAMTWPDDPSINVDWLYNEVYEPGRAGSDPNISWFELWTTENKNLKQESVAAQAAKWSKEITNVRIYGRPIRFSNRIHSEFTDNTKIWCFKCDKSIIPVPHPPKYEGGKAFDVCPECQSDHVVEYNHVEEFETAHNWPTVYVIDPHPRKDMMMMWVQISPSDDWHVVADAHIDGDCTEVRKKAESVEQELGLWVVSRLVDPNMGRSPAGQKRGVTWQDEFAAAGFWLDLADDSGVGRARINTMLKPDSHTMRPRCVIHPRCRDTIYQFMRYSWADFSKNVERDLKQVPKDTYSDYPTMLKYLANSDPSFRLLKDGAPVLARHGKRTGSY